MWAGQYLNGSIYPAKISRKYYDKNAEVASAGKVNEPLLQALLDHPFFKADLPKTTGPELFNLAYLDKAMAQSQQQISDADIMATLAAFSAHAIIDAIKRSVQQTEPFEIYLSGGGMYNPLLVKYMEYSFGREIKNTASLGILPDAKEAVLFALLANEAVAGGNTSFGNHPGLPSVSMGKVCFPR
jgi:anhydro-N-acetylmuramic acid kinase